MELIPIHSTRININKLKHESPSKINYLCTNIHSFMYRVVCLNIRQIYLKSVTNLTADKINRKIRF